ncbi:hypothetical protein OS493_032735, partial [Desmophyllum pertusum]
METADRRTGDIASSLILCKEFVDHISREYHERFHLQKYCQLGSENVPILDYLCGVAKVARIKASLNTRSNHASRLRKYWKSNLAMAHLIAYQKALPESHNVVAEEA